jgi:hypothetical protein
MLRLTVIAFLVLLVCAVPSGSTQPARSQNAPRCTAGASSVVLGEDPVTTSYPLGCVHP